ncbi:MAG: pilus assembly protein [Bacilli bacterium]|nr:pilus assembly protein [Bacilli bacterium]
MIKVGKKGQALVEFIIIMPVMIMMIFCLVDFGKIFYYKSDLESLMDETISMYNNGKTYAEVESYFKKNNKNTLIKVTNEKDEYIIFEISRETDIVTPGLNLILGKPYNVRVIRTLPYG